MPQSLTKTKQRYRPHHLLAAWVRSPLKVGALVPSSRALARAMADQIDVTRGGTVIELGPGTGVVTHALLHAGVKPEKLLMIERDHKLFQVMHMQLPHVPLECADACDLGEVLKSRGIKKVNAIVSSLPLLSMPKDVRDKIEEQMVSLMGDGGIIVQFTYGPKSPLSRKWHRSHHLVATRARFVMANVPPAHVWVYRKAD